MTGSYEGILDAGFDQFTLPLWGGTDGLDITEKEPFNNTDLAGKGEDKRSVQLFEKVNRHVG